ncbi:chemotaxis protein CheW [uncultured Desulfuromusa sp.]|uniref:chemotaxis protein CheW n=1 Tax=uncultured Desulfuromusa sp. TaxID=219183 RepID=UPI002AA709A7|nr:chemotaxis protein CheW [uncultured Desulfuromusa sp.]
MNQPNAKVAEEGFERFEKNQGELYLTFHLYDEEYALPITEVIEIIGVQSITKIPDMPDCISGIINLRGRVIPVMDVRLRFNLPHQEYNERTCVIVVEINKQTIGLVVDQVNEVIEISPSQIEPPPQCGQESDFIAGIGKVENDVKIILDVQSLTDFGDMRLDTPITN